MAIQRPSHIAYVTESGEQATRELTEEEYAMQEEAIEADDLDLSFQRSQRNAFLAESDWTQYAEDNSLSDEKKAEWATYRQALRDRFTDKTRMSELDAWPTPPS